MPGNEVEDGIHNLFELDNSSQVQHLSQAVDGNWPVLNYDLWLGKLRQIGAPLNFNLKNYSVQQLDSVRGHGEDSLIVPFDHKYIQLTPKPEYSRSRPINHQLNTDVFMLGDQNFQTSQDQPGFSGGNTGYNQCDLTSRGFSVLKPRQDNEPGDSPTLTTNSERSEITEASSDFEFLRGQQQLVRGLQSGISQPCPMQQSGYTDMQLLQQHIMVKQLQERQRQQQLQQLGDVRQHNSLNQLSTIAKQGVGVQFSPLINGTPIQDASQMFLNWGQRGASSTAQGVSNRVMISQEQGQALRSMGIVPQELDVSLYGTPIGSARSNMSQFSHLQGVSNDSVNMLAKASGQAQKPTMQLSGFSSPFLRDQCAVSPDQVCMPQGSFLSKQGFQAKNFFGQVPFQGLNTGVLSGNLQEENTPQMNAPVKEYNGRQEQVGWRATHQKRTQIGPSPGLVPLDPMEEKILYNMDDNIWDTSFGRRTDMDVSGLGNELDSDLSNAFPSIQSGSWSALMQSAVAEASSSDTGLQEEWSGLTFQNTEQSTDNQLSNLMDSEKQQTDWVDNNLQSASSFSSKHVPTFNDSSVSPRFPGFLQPGNQYSIEQREGLRQDSFRESIEKSPKLAGEWIDSDPQQKPLVGGSQQVRMHLDNAWAGQISDHSQSDAHQQRIASHNNVSQPFSKQKGDINEAMYKGRDPDGCLWKTDGNFGVSSFSRSSGGVEPVQSGTDNTLLNREDSQVNNLASVPSSSTSKAHQAISQQVQDVNRSDHMEHVDISLDKSENESMRQTQHQINNSPRVFGNSYKGEGETYEKQQNRYQRENSNDSYNSKNSGHEQGHFAQFKIFGNISSSAMNLDKGCLPDYHETSKASEEVHSRGDLRSIGPDGSNIAAQPSQNMLELLHKVDQSREDGTMAHFGSTECNSLSEVPKSEIRASAAQLYNHPSASQGFGLRLAPPSQRLPNSNRFLPSQGSPPTVSHLDSKQVDSELREKNQTWVAPQSSVQSLPPSRELSQRAHWDNKSRTSGQTGISSHLNMLGNSVAAFTSGTPYIRNQPQVQLMSNSLVASPSSQATLHSTAGKYPSLNHAVSQDNSRQIRNSLFVQQSPVLEAVPVSQPFAISSTSQQDELSARPHNVWTNVPTQRHPSGRESLKIPSNFPLSMDSSNNSMSNLPKGGFGSSEFGACSMNSSGFEHGEDQSGKDRFQQQISSDILNGSQTANLFQEQEPSAKHISYATVLPSGSMGTHSHQQDLDVLKHDNNHVQAASERNVASVGPSLKSPHNLHQIYSLQHQVQAMKNLETDPSKRVLKSYNGADSVPDVQPVNAVVGQQLYEHKSVFRPMDGGLNSSSQLNSLSSGDTKMLSFLTEAREDLSAKPLSQPALQDIPSHEMATFSQSDSPSQLSSSNEVSYHTEHGLVNMHMMSSMFKQYRTLRNGQMLPIYDPRLAKTAAGQFALGKPSQNFHMHASVNQDAADAGQVGSVRPSTAATLVASDHFSGLPSDITTQSMAIMRPKKRKTIPSELLPWHKEVTQGPQSLQNISMAEQEWAQATNRLVEKVEDEVELMEDVRPLRSKRRLILTTQLMQQLLRPAPASILSEDTTSHYDIVLYLVSKLTLGNACSLTYCASDNFPLPLADSNNISEKLQNFERTGDHKIAEVVEELTGRAKKLENDFQRLDKAASILDVRVECQELERFSVINRFAKFHSRGQADTSGTSSSSGTQKPIPQRYITALPIPRKLPEGVQCLQL